MKLTDEQIERLRSLVHTVKSNEDADAIATAMTIAKRQTMPKLNWRKREEHFETFEDGEELFVYDRWGEYDAIRFCVDEGRFEINCHNNNWGNDWEDVVYWLPLSELAATLPEEK
jgi:hypothetical protein